jgi:hypothetical protein
VSGVRREQDDAVTGRDGDAERREGIVEYWNDGTESDLGLRISDCEFESKETGVRSQECGESEGILECWND